MEARHRMWWQKKRKLLKSVGIFIAYLLGTLLVVGIIVGIIGGYLGGWNWVGVNNSLGPILKPNQQYWPAKTLWDWMQLLLVPIILAIGGYWLNKIQRKREEKATQQRDKTAQNIAQENQYESILQGYLENMSELIIMHSLRKPARDDDVREIAQVRTLTGLPRLGRKRKRNVLQFLHQSKFLLRDGNPIIDLSFADLREADLIKISLSEAELHKVDLSKATLYAANLPKVDLSEATLAKVDLRKADLSEGQLTLAKLTKAELTMANLRKATLHIDTHSCTQCRNLFLALSLRSRPTY